MSPVRVLICDDHARLRSGLSKLIATEPDLEVVGEATNGEEAIAQTHFLQPDLVLLDVQMPGRSGLTVLPELLAAHPLTKVLVLSILDDPAYATAASRAGAAGYLLKDAADSELAQAIRNVVQ